MEKKMRLLLLSVDLWDDISNGNNIHSNWFTGFDAEFANIYLVPGTPNNQICIRYFQVTDSMMAKSFFGKRAGKTFELHPSDKVAEKKTFDSAGEVKYTLYKILRTYNGEWLRFARDILWAYGRYDKKALKAFIDDFQPDVVFCPHLFSIKSRRIERIVYSMTDAPMIGFAGDAEASLNTINYNPLFWFRLLRDNLMYPAFVKKFAYYFTFSPSWCVMLARKYGVPSEPLYKCIDGKPYEQKPVNDVFKLVYAGNLYCNRWKTLSAIGDALKVINAPNGLKAEMYVYSQSVLTNKQKAALSEDKYIHFMGYVNPSELPKIYKDADIALHVESFDKKYMLETEHSFSTKLTDLMMSTCAILAICWNQNSGWNYVKSNDAAICLSSYEEILPKLQEIVANPTIIQTYARKAADCGIKNLNREKIHAQIRGVFKHVINTGKKIQSK